jgi:HK97 family phage major capsid protein
MINQLKEQRAKLISDASELLKSANGNMNAEQSAKFDALYADADTILKNIERAEKAEAAEKELRTSVQPPIGFADKNAKTDENAEFRAKAYTKYLRQGNRSLDATEFRALSDTTGANGAYLIPQGFSDKIELALKYYGGMRKVATTMRTTTGNVMPYPTNNDTANVGELLGAATVPGTVDAGDTTFGTVNFGAWTFSTKYIAVPNELLQDSFFDLESFIAKLFVDRIGRIQNTKFTVGTGTNEPAGIVPGTSTIVQGLAGAGVTTITLDNLMDTVNALDYAYQPGAKWMFSQSTLNAIRKIVDNYGQPLFGLGLNGQVLTQLLGYDYVINNDMAAPTAASAKTILFGALDKYLIRDVQDLSIMRLDEIAAYQNSKVFLGFARADAHLLDAGTHPTVLFEQAAS